MWRKLARICLRGVTTLSPVVIAACYGAEYYYSARLVRTIDSATKAPVPGIKVTCGSSGNGEWTDDRGEAVLGGDCPSYRAIDTDGALNGRYQTAVVTVETTTPEDRWDNENRQLPDLVIELTAK